MTTNAVAVAIAVVLLLASVMSLRVVNQHERGVLCRLGRVVGVRDPGLHFTIPLVDQMRKVSLKTVTTSVPSRGTVTRDGVSIDVSVVVYFRVTDPVKSLVAIDSLPDAIAGVARSAVRSVVGQLTLSEVLGGIEVVNVDVRQMLELVTPEWGVKVPTVECTDVELPAGVQRAMTREAEAERDKSAKMIAAEAESAAAGSLGDAADTMMAHPLALQLRILQTLTEIGADKNTTVVFPAPLMSAMSDIEAFLAREVGAAAALAVPTVIHPRVAPVAAFTGSPNPSMHDRRADDAALRPGSAGSGVADGIAVPQ